MRRVLSAMLIGLMTVLPTMPAGAAETRSAAPGQPPPPAQVQDLAWLEGAWKGPGIDGAPAQEIYSAPTGGAIAGHFVQADAKGAVQFYEIFQIAERGGSLVYRIKHFHADLTGWEEKAQVREFPLVAREGDAWYFDGLTIRKNGRDGMVAAVLVKHGNEAAKEYVFTYRRAR